MLSDSDSDSNDLHTLTINKHFAKAFEYKKEQEELAKCTSNPCADRIDLLAVQWTRNMVQRAPLTPGILKTRKTRRKIRTVMNSPQRSTLLFFVRWRELERKIRLSTRAIDAYLKVCPTSRGVRAGSVSWTAHYLILGREFIRLYRGTCTKAGQGASYEAKNERKGARDPHSTVIVLYTDVYVWNQSKPLTIRDAALASALADANSRSPSPEPQPLTHTEEQALLRSETRAAFHGAIHSETQGIFFLGYEGRIVGIDPPPDLCGD